MGKKLLFPVLLTLICISNLFGRLPGFFGNGANSPADDEPTATTTISATADAYTRNGTYATTNYGTTSSFVVKTTTSSGAGRAAYMKFSLASVSGTVSSAVLRIYGRCTETGIVAKLGAYGISDDSWTETGITWNNAPAGGTTAITTLDIDDQNKWRDIDITSYVQEQLSGDKTVSLLLKSPTNLNRYLEFYSREKSSSSNRPQLVITTSTTPPANQAPVLSAIGNKNATVGEPLSFTASATDADQGQTLTYSLVNAPSTASINSTTGAFSWTPEQAGDFTFSINVTDNGSPAASDDEQITVHVVDAVTNRAPVLAAIANQNANPNQTVTFTASATDPDNAQSLSYSLVNGPDGATLNSVTGAFSWTPTTTGTTTFSVRVLDNGSPAMSDEKQVTITVTTNQAPVLNPTGKINAVINEPFTFTATATDPDSWQKKTFSLVDAPDGAAIDGATGVFTWTPTTLGTYQATVRVTDNGVPALHNDDPIVIYVNEPNHAPVLSAIGNKTLTLGETVSFKATATDADAGQELNYFLFDAPDGAAIDEETGEFSWTPAAAGTYAFTVHVSDDGTPTLTDEEQITITVKAQNQAPVLASIGNKTAFVGQTLTFTATANDLDNDQTLTYSLVNAPSGAGINSTTGAFSWKPTTTGTFTFTVKVSDNGSPVATDDEQITVTVQQPASGTTTLNAAADAYTRSGTYATTNYGTATSFVIKTTTTAGVARASYIKFSLGSVSGTVSSAVLRIYGRCTEVGIVGKLAAYGISDDSWTETGINWNNAPAAGSTPITTLDIDDQNKWRDIDITSYVQEQLSGDKTVSLLLKSPTNANRYLEFYSKEKSSNRPQLVITTTAGGTQANQAPVLAAIGNKSAFVGQALSFTASASDPDQGQTLTYSLVNAPSTASINSTTGEFSWTPTATGTFTFTVKVSDNGSPALTDDEQITVSVASAPVTKTFSNTQSKAIPNPGTTPVAITVSGLPSNIDTVSYGLQSVNVQITHPNDKELTLQLQSPDGKVIYLFRKSPGVNIEATFDGVAKQFIDVNEVVSTYAGSFTSGYRPRQELSLLNNGQNPNGTWNLIVKDDSSASAAGQVSNVSLTFGPSPAKPLLSSSTLPIIRITTQNGADIVDDPKIPAEMVIINNGPNNINYVNQTNYQYQGQIGIEIRGNSSATNATIPKKQYGFETSTDVSFFGMPKQTDWILSAVMSDKSLLRNVLTYQLARQMGWWASRTQFCEVIINDEYRGVFIFQEKIKRDKNRVDIEKMSTSDVNYPNVSGGYIFKLDDIDPGAVTWTTKIEPKFRPFQFVTPKPEDVQPAQKKYLQSYVDSFEAALNGPDFDDPVKGFRRFAVDSSFIDFFLIAEMSKNLDTYFFSTYFYKKRGGKLVAMPVWDFDQAWRNDRHCDTYNPAGYDYIQVNNCGNRIIPWWWPRFMQDAKFKKDVICRYNKLRETTLSLSNIYKIIDSSAAVLNAGGQQRNFIRWNVLSKYVKENMQPYPKTYQIEIDTLKNWIAKRVEWLDADMGLCPTVTNMNKAQLDHSIVNESGLNAVYPSPFRNRLSVSLQVATAQTASVRLLDMAGKVVYQKAVSLQKGAQVLQVSVADKQLTSGLYMLQVNGATFNLTKKVVKE